MAFKLRSGNGPLKFKEMGSSPMKQPYDRTFMEVLKNPDPYSSKGGNYSPPASSYVSEYELSGTQGDDKQKKLKKAKKVAKKSGQRVKVDSKTGKAELKTTRLKKAKRIIGHPTVKKAIGKTLHAGKRFIPYVGAALTAAEVMKTIDKVKVKKYKGNDPDMTNFKNINKSKQLKKGDKIKATGPQDE